MSVKFKETVETNTRDQRPSGNSTGRDYDYDRRDYRERDSRSRRDFDDRRADVDQRDRDEGSGGREREYSYKERDSRTERDSRGGRDEDYGFKGKDESKQEKHDRSGIAHRFGEAVTKGEGAGGYLQAYLKQLESNPLRTKMLTSGSLAGLQEVLASWIAQDRSHSGNYFTSRVPKMALYGALVSAPLGHLLVKILQKTFQHRTSLKAKILQILVSNLIVAPIQNSIYLVSMAVIAGAKTFHQIRATVRAGFWPVMRVSWITSPIALAFAQQFLPPETWVPFFNIIAFVIGTYINAHTKKKRIAALRRKAAQGRAEYETRTDTYSRRDY